MTTPSPKTTAPLTTGEFGFSASEGADWSRYLTYRPIYPPSFYSRIFDYHAGKLDPRVGWDVAHDVGAGCGIVASTLASRFQTVVVSDPNEGYTELARRLLVEEAPSPKPEKRFRFVRERAEDARSVQDGSVDLVAACESIQWTDTRAAIAEFARQLRVGGTLVVTFYSRPKIAGDEGAARAWDALMWARTAYEDSFYDPPYLVANSGLDCLEFPPENWISVKRMYFNAHGSTAAFAMNDKIGESKVREGEEQIWVENEEDWCDEQGLEWFKGYFSTWVPLIPESKLQDLWDDLERALGRQKVKIEIPLCMIFATKRT